jgi:hypothetical protein
MIWDGRREGSGKNARFVLGGNFDARVITVYGSCDVLMELGFAVDLGGAYIQRSAP